ncbi:hypothetical protein JOL79_17205 [Microbispora sp. RL4-1S]|uniref:Squalene cyclase C-terminal domain-containing protein n=2 Tax=Microbispora oryzae TaxID=2806554 RepID=A0A941AJZ6_9ACTN|nr:hypothetical protein [Microbispora oryzae]
MIRPWGQVTPSVYETGRVVTLAPWLARHADRVAYLLAAQRDDGGWGAPGAYALVPTLSATEALLAELRRGTETRQESATLLEAAGRGLRLLSGWLAELTARSLPDLPAVELTVPDMVGRINGHLDALGEAGCPGLRLRLPAGMDTTFLDIVRDRIGSGRQVPEKLLHALEVAGDAAAGAASVLPTAIGTVGASPAASAAWLGDPAGRAAGDPVLRHLEAVVVRHGGPVPVGFPITVFERGWVLSWLVRAGVPVDVPPELVAELRAVIGPAGTPAGPGLPCDADTTSVALHALTLLGMPQVPASLLEFETETHFCTWQGEQGASVTVNAHVLDAFGQYAICRPAERASYERVMAKTTRFLLDRQEPDGSWSDRWHASPYYATAGCALALDEFGGDGSAEAVARAARWVLDSQREDGSWGRWGGTPEETAYAMQVLLMTNAKWDPAGREAAARGYDYLHRSWGVVDNPPMWHDKDLYLPIAIVRAVVLAAVHLAQGAGVVVPVAGPLV